MAPGQISFTRGIQACLSIRTWRRLQAGSEKVKTYSAPRTPRSPQHQRSWPSTQICRCWVQIFPQEGSLTQTLKLFKSNQQNVCRQRLRQLQDGWEKCSAISLLPPLIERKMVADRPWIQPRSTALLAKPRFSHNKKQLKPVKLEERHYWWQWDPELYVNYQIHSMTSESQLTLVNNWSHSLPHSWIMHLLVRLAQTLDHQT